MTRHTLKISSIVVLLSLLFSACGTFQTLQATLGNSSPGLLAKSGAPAAIKPDSAPAPQISTPNSLLAAYEGVLQDIYAQVNPSVVNLRVVQKVSAASLDVGQLPFGFNAPQGSEPQTPQFSQALGSGFVWDKDGHIVTNNHVIDGADKIEVTFADGSTLPATLVGADSQSDLAVIKVENAGDLLQPVQMADSKQVKVGEIAIAIGNPFGFENTMTVGIISALGRTLPAGSENTLGPTYSIPDIIQTDAPINPGNSGGVLVNDQGQVVGVTAAIESPVRANAGVGFAIPSDIVNKVVPVLIESGKFEHPYLGITGTSLTPDLAKGMNLGSDQRGVLVVEVAESGPAAKAGLQPSKDPITIDGQEVNVGGDVITAINNTPIAKMDDLIAYLSSETEVGQSVDLTVLRDGKETSVNVTLAARPAATPAPELSQSSPEQGSPNPAAPSSAWLGILGAQLTPQIAKAMDLSENQEGILIVRVETGSPADKANLVGSDKEATIDGQTVMVGGDVVVAVDGKSVSTLEELRSLIRTYQSGTEVNLTILRDGSTIEVPVTLAERPTNVP